MTPLMIIIESFIEQIKMMINIVLAGRLIERTQMLVDMFFIDQLD